MQQRRTDARRWPRRTRRARRSWRCRGSSRNDDHSDARAAEARSNARRNLSLGQQGTLVHAHQQLQLAPDVFQPASRRSAEPEHDLRRRSAGREVVRRRKDLRHARRGRRQRRAGARRPARDLGRSQELESPHDRQRRRIGHQLQPGKDLGFHRHDGDRPRVRRDRRQRASVQRLHGSAGQQQLGWSELEARTRRHHEHGLVRHLRRRRILHAA